jgi:hypothetical protein
MYIAAQKWHSLLCTEKSRDAKFPPKRPLCRASIKQARAERDAACRDEGVAGGDAKVALLEAHVSLIPCFTPTYSVYLGSPPIASLGNARVSYPVECSVSRALA